ncbi:MAG TPA: hypothetical protein VH741_01800 [Candidatus Limnocylindrales bacterium]
MALTLPSLGRAIIGAVYEHASQPLLPRRAFVRRVLRHALLALGFIAVSLALGMLGYMALAGMNAVDAFLNAAMILGGMGPVGELSSDAAKVFAGLYALYSGLVVLIAAGVIFAPVLHRVLHSLHLAEDDDDASGG